MEDYNTMHRLARRHGPSFLSSLRALAPSAAACVVLAPSMARAEDSVVGFPIGITVRKSASLAFDLDLVASGIRIGVGF